MEPFYQDLTQANRRIETLADELAQVTAERDALRHNIERIASAVRDEMTVKHAAEQAGLVQVIKDHTAKLQAAGEAHAAMTKTALEARRRVGDAEARMAAMADHPDVKRAALERKRQQLAQLTAEIAAAG